jgi:hypothetical protein
MTDRELLEYAARAAGIHYVPGESWDDDAGWNPLIDDGDALRLACDLHINIEHTAKIDKLLVVDGRLIQTRGPVCGVLCWPMETREAAVSENDLSDPYAATRLAIVRAAAEIGRNMT